MQTMESDLAVLCLPQSLFRVISKAEFDSQVSCTQQTCGVTLVTPQCAGQEEFVLEYLDGIENVYKTVRYFLIFCSRPFAGAENF